MMRYKTLGFFLLILMGFIVFSDKILASGGEWFEFEIPDTIDVIDNSYVNDINWIGIKNGHFVLQKNGKRIRFFGTTVGWNYPNASHKAIDRSVEYMKSLGINCVRIHYPGLWNRNKILFNPENIKKFDYLTYSLSKHNIYYVIYSLNMLFLNYKGDNGYSFYATRGATLMDSNYIRGIKIFWDSLMNHRNMYSGVRYKDDSALAFIILTNENSVDKLLRIKGGKSLLKIYWEKHKGRYGYDKLEFPNSENDSTYKYLLNFAAKEDSDYFVDLKSYLRDIGVKVPITLTNDSYSYYTQRTLNKVVDFIGVHVYGNYAGSDMSKYFKSFSPLIFNGNKPQSFLAKLLSVNYEKPVIVGEWNIGYPSIYRLESMILIPSLASFYDYDGSLFFSMFSHRNYVESPHKNQKYYLTSLEAPYSLQALFFPVISYAFRKGYIPAFTDSIIVKVSDMDNKIDSKFQYRYNPLTKEKGLLYLMRRVIIIFSNESNLNNIKVKIPRNNIITNRNMYWNYKRGIFSVVADKFIAYAGSSKHKFSFKGFKLNSDNERLCLSIVPIDSKAIQYSEKIIIVIGEDALHLGDEKIMKGRLFDKHIAYYPGRKEQNSIYRIPSSLLMKTVRADIKIPHVKATNLNLYAMYPNGNKQFISHIKVKNDQLDLKINTQKYKTCYFMIVNDQ